MKLWKPLRLIAVLLLLFVAAACGDDDGGSAGGSDTDTETESDTDTGGSDTDTDAPASEDDRVEEIANLRANPGEEQFELGDDDLIIQAAVEDVLDLIIQAAVEDVEVFFDEIYPELYGDPYQPLEGGLHPYGPDNPPPNCGEEGPPTYDEGDAGNAFYCSLGDFMAWDTETLTDQLLESYGPFGLAIVTAHELGHGVAARTRLLGTVATFVTEQQADCFAGAYTTWVDEGNSNVFELSLNDLDLSLGAFLQIRDPVGTDILEPNAHGSAFQRINAFQDGLFLGPERCAEYADPGTIPVVPETFVDETDYQNQGNLPYDQVEPLTVEDLEKFWTEAFTLTDTAWTTASIRPFDPDNEEVSCYGNTVTGEDAIGLAFYCPDDDTLYWDETYLMPFLWENIGDLAQAQIIAGLYAERAQTLVGLPTGTLDASLQADCFAGVWVGTIATPELGEDLTLSPGDLDEAVASFIQLSASADEVEAGETILGSAFQRLDAFDAGFTETYNNGYQSGLSLCVDNGGAEAAESEESELEELSDELSS